MKGETMKLKRFLILLSVIFVILIVITFLSLYIKRTNVINFQLEENNAIVEVVDSNNLRVKTNEKLKLNVKIADIFKTSNKIFKWESTNEEVATVDDNGLVTTKKAGITSIICRLKDKVIETRLTVYDEKKIVILVGDSRMDHFKDDNNFNETNRYEIKYTDKKGILPMYERFYVVSLSGMRYNWLVGSDKYRDDNATKYVRQIIKEYEEKNNETTNYEIKILFNLGVNDLTDEYLGNDTPSEVAQKYLTSLEKNMNNEWSSDVIDKISLNIITLLPVFDSQVKCYFPGRYNKYVVEFNDYIKNNYQGKICDIYNDIEFSYDTFRERYGNNSCATRDGLHFTEEFNTQELYPYLVNYCANK